VTRSAIWDNFLHRRRVLEYFVLINISFLAIDIYVAHSINSFAHWAEWIPFYFSVAAPFVLLMGRRGVMAGYVVGFTAIAVGILGFLFHLDSQFFAYYSIKSLVYTAPFVAPLAYSGAGFLLVMNRMVEFESSEWSRWVLFLAIGGILGNFVLALCDHAQNGFYSTWEWAPVYASALTVGFLVVAMTTNPSHAFLRLCCGVLVLSVVVGLIGFGLHFAANWNASPNMRDNFLYGAPILTPLLLPNLALLSGIGIWDMFAKSLPSGDVHPSPCAV
jgi:hypothetical protein